MLYIDVGFTGTRNGMSKNQKEGLVAAFLGYIILGYKIEFHHGACVGADVEADHIARKIGCHMNIHPSNHRTRVHCEETGDTVFPAKPPLVRDKDIVNVVKVLIAAPKSNKEELRSGTWTTVRYARKKGIEIVILKR